MILMAAGLLKGEILPSPLFLGVLVSSLGPLSLGVTAALSAISSSVNRLGDMPPSRIAVFSNFQPIRDAPKNNKKDVLGIFPKGRGGSSQFPKLLQINQVIFGMPKSFLGAKTCFTIVGR